MGHQQLAEGDRTTYNVFIVGTAGSGKSLLTHVLKDYLMEKEWHVATVNLDPGAESLPYDPDVDVRTHIDLRRLMESYQLGPNGALVLAADMMASRFQEIQSEIEECRADYVLFDTPGQMELFAYRPSGPFIVRQSGAQCSVVVFLYDAWLANDPSNFISLCLLSSSVRLRFGTPFIPVLSKVDLAPEEATKVQAWSRRPAALEEELANTLRGEEYLLYSKLVRSLVAGGFVSGLVPVSSATKEGLLDLSAHISNIFKGGEEQAG